MLPGMVVNTVQMGQFARAARGDRSQDEIDGLGGPPRQRQALIERGDSIDLSPAVLKQLDTAYGWAAGTAESLLPHPEPPATPQTLPFTALGVDVSGAPVELPARLETYSARALMPVIQNWRGPVLIAPSSRTWEEETPRWPVDLGVFDQQRLRRAGIGVPTDAKPIAIDPLSQLRRYDDAITLFRRLHGAGSHLFDLDSHELRLAAFTLLYIVADARRVGCDAVTALSRFAEEHQHPDRESRGRWLEFYGSSGLSSRFMTPLRHLPSLFQGLTGLQDFHVDVALPATVSENSLTLERTETLAPTPASELDGSIVVYDSDLCPELPVLIDWARKNPAYPPLVITTALREWDSSVLPTARVITVRQGDSEHLLPTPNDSSWRLVVSEDDPVRAALIPSERDEHRPAAVWMASPDSTT